MQSSGREPLEIIWDALLSRDPLQIRTMFSSLDGASRQVALAHLQRMATELDWHPEQRISALAALDALKGHPA